jgi:phosphate transport system protein
MTRSVDPVLKDLRETLLRMGSRAEEIIDKAFRAVASRDAELAEQVAEDDLEIDRLDVELDARVLRALALQAPVAADLREVVAIKMIATDLERVGDLARNVARSASRLAASPELAPPGILTRLAESSQTMLRRALDAYGEGDTARARAVLDQDDEIDEVEGQVIHQELEEIMRRPDLASEAVDVILIAKNLERVADHATNVAEAVIFMREARNVKHAAKLAR